MFFLKLPVVSPGLGFHTTESDIFIYHCEERAMLFRTHSETRRKRARTKWNEFKRCVHSLFKKKINDYRIIAYLWYYYLFVFFKITPELRVTSVNLDFDDLAGKIDLKWKL